MAFSKVEVIETMDYDAPDRFLDNSASFKTLHADFEAGNEFVTNSLQTKRSKLCKVQFHIKYIHYQCGLNFRKKIKDYSDYKRLGLA